MDIDCKLEIFKFEYVDNESKFLNMVVDVACKLLIDVKIALVPLIFKDL